MEMLASFEDGAFSVWVRESSWAMFAFLIVHTISMGFVVGTGAAIGLRLLGIAPNVPLSRLARFAPVIKYGLIVAICSGILLVAGYPTKALTNPLFYIKLGMLITVLLILRATGKRLLAEPRFDTGVLPTREKAIAVLCLLLWAATLTSGKFLAYTYRILLATH